MERKIVKSCAGAVAVALCLVTSGALANESDAQLISIEKSLWAGWAAHDSRPFEKYLTDDTVNLAGGSYLIGKAALLKDIKTGDCKVAGYTIGDVKVVHPADNVAILVYSATQDGTCGGHALDKKIHVTAVYVKQGGDWKEAAYSEAPARK